MIKYSRPYILLILIAAYWWGCNIVDFNSGPRKFYVDAVNGNDRNRGNSPGKAFKSIEKLNKMEFQPGDQIVFTPGQTFTGFLKIQNIRSLADLPFVITGGMGRATIESGDSSGIVIENCSNIIIRNLNLTGSGRLKGNRGNGIELKNVEHGNLDSIDASGYIWNGIGVRGGRDINVTHCHVYNNGFAGIDVNSGKSHDFKDAAEFKTMHNLYIGYCVAENNPGCPLIMDNHSGNGILIAGVTGGVIEYCEAMNNGWDMPRTGNGPVGIWAYMCDSIIIQQCYSHHNRTSDGGKDGGGFDLDGGVTHSIMQYNHSAWNEGGGYGLFQYAGASEWSDNIIRYNTSLNDGTRNSHAGIHVWCDPSAVPMKNCSVVNNIVISDQGHDVYFQPGDYTGFDFENNIFTLTAEGNDFIKGNFTGAKFQNNQYWSFYKSSRNLPQPDVKYDPDPIYSEPSLDIPMTKQ